MKNHQSGILIKSAVRRIFNLALVAIILFGCSDTLVEPEKPAPSMATTTVPSAPPVACSTCTYVVPLGLNPIDGIKLGIKPGAVICLDATKNYGPIRFTNIVGTASSPIIIKTCGAQTALVTAPSTSPYGFKMERSKYFRITGGNTDGVYGIKVTGGNMGVQMDLFTTNFEIDHVEVASSKFAGIMAKTDPSCDNATIRGNFTLTDAFIHHNFVHESGGEGLYIGNSFYANGVSTPCGIRFPGDLKNIKIYNNRILNSGWESIQLGSAVSGAEVHDNIVENYGVANVEAQNNGIQIGEGTGGLCYNNYVKGGKGSGIIVLGLGDNVVYNNIVINAGGFGIFCDDRLIRGTGFSFLNNTIINSGSDGIRLYADNPALNNNVINNLIANPKSYTTYKYPRTANDSYLYLLNSSVKVKVSNNLYTQVSSLANSFNLGSFNTTLLTSCAVVDKGINVSTYGVKADFINVSRPRGVSVDIGAMEYK